MIINQAIYTSANAQGNRGYHLVAKSSGITEHVAQGLCRWSPSHGCLSDDGIETESLNFFQPFEDWFAISRTVCGCPEYSQRGGMRIVTIHLVFQAQQLAHHGGNIIAFARTALTTGLLTLPLEMTRDLPQIEFPEPGRPRQGKAPVASEIENLLRTGKEVAMVGAIEPLAFLESLLQSMPPLERVKFSFATGLKPSAQRPFRIQFFRSADMRLKNELKRLGMYVRDCPAA